ncbi:hypothetical protein [Sorangium cellulosum]|uniref:hypothetical protein n=1 Tax=Sorangium cellulosum TaxID=56 RepID=UPI00101102A7|nr:hypothetical protein [Sorangium cellulosum]
MRADRWPADLSPTPTPPPVALEHEPPAERGLSLGPPPFAKAHDPLDRGLPLGLDPALHGPASFPLGEVAPVAAWSPPSPAERRARRRRALGAAVLVAATLVAVVLITAREIAARVPAAAVAALHATTPAGHALVPASRALILAARPAREGAGAEAPAAAPEQAAPQQAAPQQQQAAPQHVAPLQLERAQAATPPPAIRHDGYASIRGGVLFTPVTFTPAGSSYDLLVHFHGNTQLVRESAEVAGLDAAVAVINLGVSSGAYEDSYAVPGTYERLLADVDRALARRGLPSPRLRRVALSSWSAGYGAVAKILERRRDLASLDAILVTDGIHCGLAPWHESGLNTPQLASFARAAQRAASGEILFTITHSEIDPGSYASSSATASYLLEMAAGRPVERSISRDAPPHLRLRAAEGAVSRKLEKRMVPTTEASVGDLHVRGYQGNTAEHHMAHLFQMASTVLPELVERWREGGDPP